jgi:hypothetical protein
MRKRLLLSVDRKLLAFLLGLSKHSAAYNTLDRLPIGQYELAAVNADLGLDLEIIATSPDPRKRGPHENYCKIPVLRVRGSNRTNSGYNEEATDSPSSALTPDKRVVHLTKLMTPRQQNKTKFGLYAPNFGKCSDPRTLVEIAVTAERFGWDGFLLWTISSNGIGSRLQ